MAQPSSPGSAALSDTICRLRSIAENHLREIGEENLQEEKDQARRNQELERYTKQRRRDKMSTLVPVGATTTPKMRSAQGKLSRPPATDIGQAIEALQTSLTASDGIERSIFRATPLVIWNASAASRKYRPPIGSPTSLRKNGFLSIVSNISSGPSRLADRKSSGTGISG